MEGGSTNPGSEGGTIKRINAAVTHRICSGQVIVDLATAVKELVENALDAGATSIEVRLQGYGAKLIEVSDNGQGIPPEDFEALALKYTTSKISDFNDLQNLSTFGFRGEALSSLCALADMTVITRTPSQQVGSSLEYNKEGVLVKKSLVARAAGTTVALRNLFSNLPVRHKELMRNVKREFGKLLTVLQAYAIICTQVRINTSNQVGAGSRVVLISTQGPVAGSSTARVAGIQDPSLPVSQCPLYRNIISVLGTKVADGLQALNESLPDLEANISGYVSKAVGAGAKSTGDARQFLFLNGRPVDIPRVTKTINEAFRSLSSAINSAVKPTFVVNINMPSHTYDINVTPDKRKVFMESEAALVAALKQGLEQLWEPSRNTYLVISLPASQAQPAAHHSAAAHKPVGSLTQPAAAARTHTQQSLTHFTKPVNRLAQALSGGLDHTDSSRPTPPATAAAGSPGGLEPPGSVEQADTGEAESEDDPELLPDVPATQPNSQAAAADTHRRGSQEPTDVCTVSSSPEGSPSGQQQKAQVASDSPAHRATGRTSRLHQQPHQADASPPSPTRPPTTGEGQHNGSPVLEGGVTPPTRLTHASPPPPAQSPAGRVTAANDADDDLCMVQMCSDSPGVQAGGRGSEAGVSGGAQRVSRSPAPPAAWTLFSVTPRDLVPASDGAEAGLGQQGHSGGPGMLHTGGPGYQQEEQEEQEQGQGRAGGLGSVGDSEDVHMVASEEPEGHQGSAQGAALDPPEGQGEDRQREPVASEQQAGVARAGRGRAGGIRQGRQVIVDLTEEGTAVGTGTKAALDGKGGQESPHPPHCVVLPCDMGRLARVMQARAAAAALKQQAASQAAQTQAVEPNCSEPEQADEPGVAGQEEEQQHLMSSPVRAAKRQRFHMASLQEGEAQLSSSQAPEAAAAAAAAGGGSRAEREAAAERELQRVFNKEDFRRMQVVGQFNLGFILARLGQELFIIDQHASDEKRTFEKLQATVVLNRQPLLLPRALDLTYLDEMLIRDHLDSVFRRNGFDFKDDPRTGQLMMTAVPYCKGVTFGPEDVRELVGAIREGSDRLETLRPSRVRAILASRACRSSIMIGRALDTRLMNRLVKSMADLDAPWNCPHGRPTMRHACVLPAPLD